MTTLRLRQWRGEGGGRGGGVWPNGQSAPSHVGLNHDADSTVFDQVDNCEEEASRSVSEKVLRGSRKRQPPASS